MISFEEYCELDGNKDKSESYNAFLYCRYVKNRPEIRDRITDSDDAYYYCRGVQNRVEMAKRIVESSSIKRYKNHFGFTPQDYVLSKKMEII
jgi:hypothetical protein